MAWVEGLIAALVLALGYVSLRYQGALRRERLLARTDELTRIENRRAFYEVATREFERARRYGHPFTLAYFDVDGFKEVNARLGHHVGDGMLRMVAETARHAIRSSDVVARLGGDEFALLLNEAGPEAAIAVIEKLQAALREVSRGTGLPLTISGGVVTCLQPAESLEAVIGTADQLLYGAKHAGKGTFWREVVAPQPLEGFEPARLRRPWRLPPKFDLPLPPPQPRQRRG
jgi:diguanylate cyclase (GGDEF)-like protein